MLAQVPSFGQNPRGSPDFLAYPVLKACQGHGLGNWVPRCLGVAHSASTPKASQALGCSLTPGLRVTFGQVTCMARATSVPGLWTFGFLLLCCVALGFGLCRYPAFLRRGDVCWGLIFCLHPAIPGQGSRRVCSGAVFAFILLFLVAVPGVRISVRVLP